VLHRPIRAAVCKVYRLALHRVRVYPWFCQQRDGEIATWAREKGAGLASAELLPGAHLVRAFNAIGYLSEATRPNQHRASTRRTQKKAPHKRGFFSERDPGPRPE